VKKIELDIVGLSYSNSQNGAYALIFNEKNGNRRLPIIIGSVEAQAIAIELEGMAPSRPLTHDLFKSFAEEFNFDIIEVIIYNLIEGIFFSKLICKKADGSTVEIDSRTSDAVAIAVRFKCPINTFDFILDSAGIKTDETEEEKVESKEDSKETPEVAIEIVVKDPDDEYTLGELDKKLRFAIEEEDYEKASKLRDLIEKIKGDQKK